MINKTTIKKETSKKRNSQSTKKRTNKKKINNTYLLKLIKSDPITFMVPILSIIIAIISSFTIGKKLGIFLFFIINIIYFSYYGFKNRKKNTKQTKNDSKINKKQMKRKNNKHKIFLLIFLLLFIFGIIALIGFFSYIVINAPEFSEDLLYVTEPSVLLDKNGNEIAKLGSEKRVIITYDEMPEVLIDAIVATEDSRFFEHKGVDWARFLKATANQLMGRNAGGASTLTMQVSKNSVSKDNTATGIKGIIRKFNDVYVSVFKIEKNYTKEQIIEFYVNSYELGNRSFGIEQASLGYFGKSAKDLNLSEAALIAGLFQAPSKYNPYKNPENAEKRRQTVLYLMKRHGYITEKEYDVAMKMTVDKIILPADENPNSLANDVSPYQSFIDTVVDEVKEKTGFNPYSKSMTIYTTLDTEQQKELNKIMNGENYYWENEKVQAGIAIISVDNGSITSIGGSRNTNAIDQLNYATEITKQIGSTAKPLYDYGPAIEYNNWSSYNILVDEPITYSDGTKINNWNGAYEGFETMRVALKGSRNIPALKAFKKNDKSKIIEFVTNLGLTPEIYSCDVGYTLKKNKCYSNDENETVVPAKKATTLHEAHAIGGYNGESPLTMAAAYSTFSRGGVYIEPYSFTKIVYSDTNEEYINPIKKNRVMSEETAYIISDMLATTATQAMGGYYNINGIRYAAKTGTTNYDEKKLEANGLLWSGAVNDLWTIGFNTEYAIGVWYGYDKLNTEYAHNHWYNVLSSGQHERLFQAVGKKVFTNGSYFKQPSGVVAVEVESGCPEATLPSEYTPAEFRQTELFKAEYVPDKVSERFAKLTDVSNLKASVNSGKVTLTWNEVKQPEINSKSFLLTYYKPVFENDSYLNSYVNSRISFNNSYLGAFGYNIYKKSNSGTLTLIDFVTTNKYEIKEKKSGEYTYVIKTSYSNFKSNMSDGKTISVNVNSSLLPDTNEELEDPILEEETEDNT